MYGEADQQSAFTCVKSEFSSASALCALDLNSPHRISADMSQFALGVVLLLRNVIYMVTFHQNLVPPRKSTAFFIFFMDYCHIILTFLCKHSILFFNYDIRTHII